MDKNDGMFAAGALVVLVSVPAARYLAAEAWTPGAFGFWILLSVPGFALMARDSPIRPANVALLLPVALLLLGLDVTDSSRDVVVVAGFSLAALCVATLGGSLVILRRRRVVQE